jgi:hypothetical protein
MASTEMPIQIITKTLAISGGKVMVVVPFKNAHLFRDLRTFTTGKNTINSRKNYVSRL